MKTNVLRDQVLLSLSAALLSGCATSSLPVGDGTIPSAIPSAIVRRMDVADQQKLQWLLDTAQSQEIVHWKSATTPVHYTFSSFKIFLNEQGQPCRRFQLLSETLLFKRDMLPCTVCRDETGHWG